MPGDVHEDGPPPPPLSAEELEFLQNFAELVDFYRVSQAAALWRAFWPGGFVLLPLGSVITALSVAPSVVPPLVSPYVALLGLGVTASGPLWCIVSLFRAIRRDDLYVAIRTSGLCLRLDVDAREHVIPWDEIDEVSFDADARAVLVRTKSGIERITARFAELELDELARRLRDARRLAVWNRLAPKWSVDRG